MTTGSLSPAGPNEPFNWHADYERAMKMRGQNEAAPDKTNPADGAETAAWGKDGFTFGDVLDIINPLQHIPIISDIYRAVTGDEIAPAARLMGGSLLGGLPGLAVAAVNTAVHETTGQDLGEMAIATLFGDDALDSSPLNTAGATAIAAASPAATPDAVKKPVALQFAEAATPAVPGAAAGTSAPELLGGGINFFNMNNRNPVANADPSQQFAAAPQAALAARPGTIQNRIFRPLPGLQEVAAAKAAATTPAPQPAPTNLALLNEDVAQTVKPTAPAGATAGSSVRPGVPSGHVNENGMTELQQKAANRDALLAAARDLRKAFTSHSAYKTDAREKSLQQP
jgi:hypothetical protein